MPFAVEETTIAAIHAGYRDGSLTCRALVQTYLDRIERIDRGGPALNSYAALNPHALDEADALDRAHAQSGPVGKLHGIPVAIKDQAETAGIETRFGSVALSGYVPKTDATIVAKLKAAGAILLGKTTMPDFATSWFSQSSVSHETRNPYDTARDPGGSSAGTGAAIAANLAAIGIGEDTGGSIRVPASFCNLVGVRVTPGLISRAGLSPLVVFQDTAGPMTRTVTDAALLLDAVVGFDPRDAYSTANLIAHHPASYADGLSADGLHGKRLGLLREALGSDEDPDCAQVNTVVRAAIEGMRGAGAEVVEISLPDVMAQIIDTSLYLTHSRHDINGFLAARPEAPYHSLDDIIAAGKYDRRIDLLADVANGPAHPTDDPEYYRKLAAREGFQRAVLRLMAEHRLDALTWPATQVLPPTLQSLNEGRWPVLAFPTNTLIASQTWMPSICLPAGFSPDGIPVGIEIVVPPYHEPDLFRLGFAFEQATKHRRAPAGLGG